MKSTNDSGEVTSRACREFARAIFALIDSPRVNHLGWGIKLYLSNDKVLSAIVNNGRSDTGTEEQWHVTRSYFK